MMMESEVGTTPSLSLSSSSSKAIVIVVEENEDWVATNVIYDGTPKSVKVHPTGFVGSIDIPMSILSKIAFFRRVSKEGHFRYFTSTEPAVLRLEFIYFYGKLESDELSPPPSSVRVKWNQFPRELLPDDQADAFLEFLRKECNRRLSEDEYPSSFGICEFCEHEAFGQYFQTDLFHQDSEYQMIRLPDKMDHMYHKNNGTLIHPKELAYSSRRPRQTNSGNTYRIFSKEQAWNEETKKPTPPPPPETAEEFARITLMDRWEYLYSTTCPICMDEMTFSDGVTLPSCQHFACKGCFEMYLKFKVDDLFMITSKKSKGADAPFCCPVETCRKAMPFNDFVGKYLEKKQIERVERWYKDLEFPPCFSLDQCLSPACGAKDCMRRKPTKLSVDTDIYCEVCNKMWCELCLKRVYAFEADPQQLYHTSFECDPTNAILLCQRYLAASEQKKEACRKRYPWIVTYADHRQHDAEANKWVLENGQVCPSCRTGVERSEGCFHMQCVVCSTHFCYECGDELFPPYYGTHHCWERDQLELR